MVTSGTSLGVVYDVEGMVSDEALWTQVYSSMISYNSHAHRYLSFAVNLPGVSYSMCQRLGSAMDFLHLLGALGRVRPWATTVYHYQVTDAG